jgi:riboflavin biosynthesis pyrimidine reductase
MRALLPAAGGALTDDDVHRHYAERWIDAGGLRANFVTSVDGSAHAGGTSAGLQTPGDNRVFAALRDLADVVVVGAGTAAAEGYGPARFNERRLAIRADFGLSPDLPIAVVSRTLRLDPAAALFTAADPGARPIVLTCTNAPSDARRTLTAVADLVDCGAETVDPARARAALEARGLTRILSEGGPTVFADQVAAGVVDELCLTLSPLLVGPGPARLTDGTPWAASAAMELTGLLEEDGALFARYRIAQPRDTAS